MKKKIFLFSKAFTIPEILIAIGLFLVVITSSSGIFLLGLRTQRQLIEFLNATENLSYALEVIARDVRMGKNFSLINNQTLSLTNYKNQAVVYRLNNRVLERSLDGGATFQPLTAPNLEISSLQFLISGEDPNDQKQTRITIALEIKTFIRKTPVAFNLQTTLSPRNLQL